MSIATYFFSVWRALSRYHLLSTWTAIKLDSTYKIGYKKELEPATTSLASAGETRQGNVASTARQESCHPWRGKKAFSWTVALHRIRNFTLLAVSVKEAVKNMKYCIACHQCWRDQEDCVCMYHTYKTTDLNMRVLYRRNFCRTLPPKKKENFSRSEPHQTVW